MTAHADGLILAGPDEARDPATELFLEEHLRECDDCRELSRKVGRLDGLIAMPERPLPVPPRSSANARPARRVIAIAPVAVALVAVGVLAGTALREWRSANDVTSTGAAAERTISFDIKPISPWRTTGTGRATLSSRGDLVLEVSVRGPASEISRPATDPLQPNFIWHLVEGTCASWERNEPGHSVIARWTLVPQHADAQDFRYVVSKADLDPMTRPHAVAAFRNGGGGPLYACGDVASFATSPGASGATATPPGIVALSDQAGCPRTQATDASGVRTANGTIGIVGDTYWSSAAVNDTVLLVRRGAALGDTVGLDFRQLGSSAPASLVSYSVPATLRRTAWGEVAFPFGVKPIGFANSCWRLFVDGTDSGIVLFVGP